MSQAPSKTKPNWVAVTERPAGLRPSGAHFCRGLWTDAGMFWARALVLPLSKMPLPLFPSAADGKLEGRVKPFLLPPGFGGISPPTYCARLPSARLLLRAAHHPGAREMQEAASFISAAAQEREEPLPAPSGGPRSVSRSAERGSPPCRPPRPPLGAHLLLVFSLSFKDERGRRFLCGGPKTSAWC